MQRPDEHPAVEALRRSALWKAAADAILVIACSGGRDSVALLCAANELMSEANTAARPARLICWHLDHGLRSDSGSDASFVAKLCERLGIECRIERVDLPAMQRQRGGNSEALARQERYRLLQQQLAQLRAASRPVLAATAHHLMDQAETLLLNLSRGAHLAGLRGMAAQRDGVHRPWLLLNPRCIADYARARGIEWVEDASNQDTSLARNRIRHKVLPELLAINPQALEHIAALAGLASQAEELLNLAATVPAGSITLHDISATLPLLHIPQGHYEVVCADDAWTDETIAQSIYRLLRAHALPLDSQDYTALERWLAEVTATLQVAGWNISREGPGIYSIESNQHPQEPKHDTALLTLRIASAADSDLADWRQIDESRLQRIPIWPELLRGVSLTRHQIDKWTAFLPAALPQPLILRTRSAGDSLRLADGSRKKLGDIFTDAKVPPLFRDAWAVLTDAHGEIVWLPGLADSAAMAYAKQVDELIRVSLERSSL